MRLRLDFQEDKGLHSNRSCLGRPVYSPEAAQRVLVDEIEEGVEYAVSYEAIAEANIKAYKREEQLAMSIADKIPINPVEQDRRSKNRFREHSGDGHELVDSERTSQRQPNHTLHVCHCGWIGWLIPAKETDEALG